MKKAIILILVLLLSFGFTTYAEDTQPVLDEVPDKIDYKWAMDQYSKREEINLMYMSVEMSLPNLEETLEELKERTDPIRGASTPAMRANNMVTMKYGIAEQEKRIEDLKNSVQKNLDQQVIGLRNSLRSVYASEKNVSFSERSLRFAKTAFDNAEYYYSNGIGTLSSLKSAMYNYLSAQVDLEDAKIAFENSLMSFNRTIGMDLLTVYKEIDIDETLMIKNTNNIKPLADQKYESLIKAKEYEIEKEQYRKESLESLFSIYPNSKEHILEELETIEERISDLNDDLIQMKITQRRYYNERAQAMIDSFDSIDDTKENIAELKKSYNKTYSQYLDKDIGYVAVEQSRLNIEKAENNLKQQIYNFNTSYMSYLLEMEI
ncbi:MAG TPA: hypothetical protein DDZ89_11960 [Clostridiales bacterium]|nr:hypothetical protein [Clostridiales bacterium]